MKTYIMRELLAQPLEAIWDLPPGPHKLVFDDGEIETHQRVTILSAYMMQQLQHWPKAQVLKAFHLQDRTFDSGIMLRIMNDVLWEVHRSENEQVDVELLAFQVFDAVNLISNEFTARLGRYVRTLSMFDVLEVMDHPEIRAANAEVEPTHHSIENVCYPRIEAALKGDDLKDNPIVAGIRSRTLRLEQTMQCIGPRGYVTDINSDIFPEPITTSLAEGNETLYGNLIESRAGSKALLYNSELISKSETFNRQMQLISQTVQNLHREDCGTRLTIEFPVTKTLLPQLKGKYYVTAEGKLDWLRGTETELIGQHIQMRSVLACEHPDPGGVCAVCYGRLSYGIARGSNIGHNSAAILGDKITSSLLSTKHQEATSKVEQFVLNKTEAKFLRYGDQEEVLYLQEHLKGKPLKLVIAHSEAANLADILMLENLSGVRVEELSAITRMQVIVNEGTKEEVSEVLTVSLYNRRSSFTLEALEYIRKQSWKIKKHGNSMDNASIIIDLTDFDVDQPFLQLPHRHVNMHEVLKQIENFMHSGTSPSRNQLQEVVTQRQRKKGRRKRRRNNTVRLTTFKDPGQALATFLTMISDRLTINIAHCEVLIYAMRVRDLRGKDFRLPKPGLMGEFAPYSAIITSRSLGVATAYGAQAGIFTRPSSYLYPERNAHPYDTLLLGY